MYFLAGEYKTGWMLIGTTAYHFDLKNGTMHKTTILEDVPTTCSVQGHLSVKCECGETYETKYDKPSGHSFSKVVADDGTVYYHCDRCGKISTMDMPFVDVDDTDWFAEAVYYCYQNSLLRGRSEMSFDPDAAMTRAELVTVLWRIAGSPNSDNVGKTPFTDVPAGSWYTAAVNWCSENKIVNGIGDGLFAPDDQITREQIVTILYRFAKFRGLDVGDTTDLAKKFTDAARVSDYAKEALSWAVARRHHQRHAGQHDRSAELRYARRGRNDHHALHKARLRNGKLNTAQRRGPRPLRCFSQSLFGFSGLPRWKCAAVCAIIFRNPI